MGREDKAKQAAKGRGRSVLPTKNARSREKKTG